MAWWEDWEDGIEEDSAIVTQESSGGESDEEKTPKKLPAAEMDALIRKAIGTALNFNPLFRKDETLVLTLYSTLKAFYIQEVPYVLLSAPTGTGKSVIGDLVHFTTCYIDRALLDESGVSDGRIREWAGHTYFLTSSKLLQEQLEGDFERFNLHDHFTMLKGTANYECTKATDEALYSAFRGQTQNATPLDRKQLQVMYPDRDCRGMSMPERQLLPCYAGCPYISKRFAASESSCAVVNYAYFLNVMRMPNNPYFGVRPLTIADEAHLLPDVILNMFNIQLTQYSLNKIHKIYQQIEMNFRNAAGGEGGLELGSFYLEACFNFFDRPKPEVEQIREYVENYTALTKWLQELSAEMCKKSSVFEGMFKKDISKLVDELKGMATIMPSLDALVKRPDDLFIESEFVGNHVFNMRSMATYKHTVYDMSEAEMCREHFLSKTERVLFMSATMGNIDEFALLMGIEKGQYAGFRLASNFNFEKSPIFLTKSGYLNYDKFNENIEKVLLDALHICEKRHLKQKGIIHTATFAIADRLQELIRRRPDLVPYPQRYLFYRTSQEKEEMIRKLKDPKSGGYIAVGPSLYEGIDLPGDNGRVNILIKAPYSGLSEYTKKKSARYPFWYNRQTLEKVVQAIGRTNRYVDDWSHVYLLDGLLEKLIFQTQDFIVGRVKIIKL